MKKKLRSVLGRQIPIKAEGRPLRDTHLHGCFTESTSGKCVCVCVCGLRVENKPMGADVHVELLKMYLRLVNSPVPPVVEHVVFGCKACLKGN